VISGCCSTVSEKQNQKEDKMIDDLMGLKTSFERRLAESTIQIIFKEVK